MAAVPITIIGIQTDEMGSRNVTITGMASLTGLGVGGGPVIPPGKPIDPGAHPEHPIYWPPGSQPHPEHPIVIPPVPPEFPNPPTGGVKPPPPEGGWGFHPEYGWGYFPGPGEPSPKA